MRKGRHTWRISAGGGTLFILLLLVQLAVVFILRLTQSESTSLWEGLGAAVMVSLVAVFGWFVSLRTLIADGLWRLPRTWYEAMLALAALYVFYGVFILVTGYIPSKYHSHQVPRTSGIIWLYRALAPSVIGAIIYPYSRHPRRDRL